MYDTQNDINPNDLVSTELTMRLLGVMQSLDTDRFYQKQFKNGKIVRVETE